MKKATNIILSLTLIVIALTGCATHTGNVYFPEPSANFTPKETYAVSYDKLWDATLNALDANRIATVSADKVSGTIQTDGIEGPSATVGYFLASQSTRYEYNISLRNQSDGNVKLNIFCKIEDTVSNGQGSTQWHDVTSQNADRAKKLETWLYEQIEKEIQ